jgi:hypothetical protein
MEQSSLFFTGRFLLLFTGSIHCFHGTVFIVLHGAVQLSSFFLGGGRLRCAFQSPSPLFLMGPSSLFSLRGHLHCFLGGLTLLLFVGLCGAVVILFFNWLSLFFFMGRIQCSSSFCTGCLYFFAGLFIVSHGGRLYCFIIVIIWVLWGEVSTLCKTKDNCLLWELIFPWANCGTRTNNFFAWQLGTGDGSIYCTYL